MKKMCKKSNNTIKEQKRKIEKAYRETDKALENLFGISVTTND